MDEAKLKQKDPALGREGKRKGKGKGKRKEKGWEGMGTKFKRRKPYILKRSDPETEFSKRREKNQSIFQPCSRLRNSICSTKNPGGSRFKTLFYFLPKQVRKRS